MILVVLVFALGALVIRSRDDSSGDPGGRVLAEISSIAAALPADARLDSEQRGEPIRDSCDGRSGTEGWSPVSAAEWFHTALSAEELRGQIDAGLQRVGWRPAHSVLWELDLANGSTASASLSPYGDGRWSLVAIAPPVGTAASGC